MSNLVMYIDGSEFFTKHTKLKKTLLGWGVVALHPVHGRQEFAGSFEVEHGQTGYHEMTALHRAIEYAEMHGFKPSEVTIFTDCQWVANSGFNVTPENFSKLRGDTIDRIKRFKKFFFNEDDYLVEKMIYWLMNMSLHKVKGHSFIIDNMRADYLARSGSNKKVLDYSDWLKSGFEYWNSQLNVSCKYFIPFLEEAI
jgi:ribonuclease HI